MIDKCDRCEREKSIELEIFGYKLCEKCKQDLNVVTIHWMMKMCEFSEARKKPTLTAPIKIDWDKACALKLAGWSNTSIADELRCKTETIRTGMRTKLEMYKHGMRFGTPLHDEEDKDDEWYL